MNDPIRIPSSLDPGLHLEVIPGHFSSDRFHINYAAIFVEISTEAGISRNGGIFFCRYNLYR